MDRQYSFIHKYQRVSSRKGGREEEGGVRREKGEFKRSKKVKIVNRG